MEIGHINFLNCLPLTYYFQQTTDNSLQARFAVPSQLNHALTSKELMISPVSSIIYARNYQELMILPDLSIMADGKVESIFLVSKVPIEDLQEASIALTPQSATSHCLLKIILQKKYHLQPQYEIQALDLDNIFSGNNFQAALFIGDNALYLNHHRQEGLYYYDVGQLWKDLTGKCMVYALWVVNADFAREHHELTAQIQQQIRQGFDYGIANLREGIRQVAADKPFSEELIYDYLQVIQWKLGKEQLEALALFYHYACELGLIEAEPDIKLFR